VPGAGSPSPFALARRAPQARLLVMRPVARSHASREVPAEAGALGRSATGTPVRSVGRPSLYVPPGRLELAASPAAALLTRGPWRGHPGPRARVRCRDLTPPAWWPQCEGRCPRRALGYGQRAGAPALRAAVAGGPSARRETPPRPTWSADPRSPLPGQDVAARAVGRGPPLRGAGRRKASTGTVSPVIGSVYSGSRAAV
jgi:hypothetical protein